MDKTFHSTVNSAPLRSPNQSTNLHLLPLTFFTTIYKPNEKRRRRRKATYLPPSLRPTFTIIITPLFLSLSQILTYKNIPVMFLLYYLFFSYLTIFSSIISYHFIIYGLVLVLKQQTITTNHLFFFLPLLPFLYFFYFLSFQYLFFFVTLNSTHLYTPAVCVVQRGFFFPPLFSFFSFVLCFLFLCMRSEHLLFICYVSCHVFQFFFFVFHFSFLVCVCVCVCVFCFHILSSFSSFLLLFIIVYFILFYFHFYLYVSHARSFLYYTLYSFIAGTGNEDSNQIDY